MRSSWRRSCIWWRDRRLSAPRCETWCEWWQMSRILYHSTESSGWWWVHLHSLGTSQSPDNSYSSYNTDLRRPFRQIFGRMQTLMADREHGTNLWEVQSSPQCGAGNSNDRQSNHKCFCRPSARSSPVPTSVWSSGGWRSLPEPRCYAHKAYHLRNRLHCSSAK